MIVLSNEEIESLLTMSECMSALEAAYTALSDDRALNTPRVDSIIPLNEAEGVVYSFKTMGGVIRNGVQALRINSDVIHWPEIAGNRRRTKIPKANGRWVGLVYLYDPETGMPLAIMPDGVMQHFRVGAANGLAARYLAPNTPDTIALLGSGWQAETQLLAILEVVHPKKVKVFSPTSENRAAFIRKMQGEVSVELEEAMSANEAVQDAEVIVSATNSMSPILRPEWIEPGRHFSTIKAQEVGKPFFEGVTPYLHTKRQKKAEVISAGGIPQFEKEKGWWRQPEVDIYPDLADLVTGAAKGRESAEQATLFVNNVGMGLQFAAVGGFLLDKAKERGLGHELPDDWFTETVHP